MTYVMEVSTDNGIVNTRLDAETFLTLIQGDMTNNATPAPE